MGGMKVEVIKLFSKMIPHELVQFVFDGICGKYYLFMEVFPKAANLKHAQTHVKKAKREIKKLTMKRSIHLTLKVAHVYNFGCSQIA